MANICPYPGLRPFNENEAIFFKGRDEHIKKIIAQLSHSKFIMVTGASGDGKSSLIYAGVIPNAKAGFFKAKHNNWVVADFRPEKSPLKNLAQTISAHLGINDNTATEKELGYGFSSLVNLYKSSSHYLDTNAESFQQLDLAEQKQQKRKAANLLILVDQFEELFTNSENFSNDQPSLEAQTTVNLLIETSKIALANDIPIYVICTMRSDYIGQCSAFRGLPELIGFSQFFVPRLKRKEIQQVITEPAVLSGNRISNRLTQTLVNELGEGLDQLPVLQHALNQIWKVADSGSEEMDLIHLVKVGGLHPNYLQADDKNVFNEWFDKLPDFKKNFLKNPSLENVLNAHANELYETAHESYNQQNETTVDRETAQFIIKKAFQCLTKIDGARAVRSRMNLEEVTHVIARQGISSAIVGGILDIFRMPGNTFLRPFVDTDVVYTPLNKTDILDITHESLIRNWQLLLDWTNEEYNDILTFRDFEKQMQRWVDSKKSSDYLLPIGPLTYFESWFLKLNPNQYWLKKYDESDAPESEKLKKAGATINHGKEFIKRSARKLFLTRTVMKYGAMRIAASFAALIAICAGIYFYVDYRSKLNENVLPKIEEKCFALLNNKTVGSKEKAAFLINEEILHQGTIAKNLESLGNDTTVIDISLSITKKLLTDANPEHSALPDFALHAMRVLCKVTNRYTLCDTGVLSETKVNRLCGFIDVMNFVKIRYPNICDSLQTDKTTNIVSQIMYSRYINRVLTDTALKNFNGITLLNSLKLYMLQCKTDTNNFKQLIQSISPFETLEAKEIFKGFFPESSTIDTRGGSITYKGGYIVLASLYSGVGNIQNFSRCLDSLQMQNTGYNDYYRGGYSDVINFSLNFMVYNDVDFKNVISAYSQISLLDKEAIAHKLVSELPSFEYAYFPKPNNYLDVKYVLPRSNYNLLWNYYFSSSIAATEAKTKNDPLGNDDDLLLRTANYYKAKGLNLSSVYMDSTEANTNFEKFSETYSKISASFLKEEKIYKVKSSVIKHKPSYILLFPNDILHTISVEGWDQTWMNASYSTILFEKFIMHKGMANYFTADNNELLFRIIYNFYPSEVPDECESIKPINASTAFFSEFIDSINLYAKRSNNKELLEEGILQLYAIETKFNKNQADIAVGLLEKWSNSGMLVSLKTNQKDFKEDKLRVIIKNIAAYSALNNKEKLSYQLIATLNAGYEKRNAFMFNSLLLEYAAKTENSFGYIDTLTKLIGDNDKFGLMLLKVLGRTDEKKYKEKAIELIAVLGEDKKNDALTNYAIGIAESGEYFKSVTTIPQFLSRDREFKILNGIVGTHIRKQMLAKSLSTNNINSVTCVNSGMSWLTKDWESARSESGGTIYMFGGDD